MHEELPKGWVKTRLGDIRRDNSVGITQEQMRGETFELYSVPAFSEGKPEVISGNTIGSNKVLVSPSDVLLCKINPRINRAWVVGEAHGIRQVASTEWIVFSKQEGLSPNFLRYFFSLDTFRDYLAANVSGVGGSLMRVRPSVVEAYPFTLPPTAEQERIVSKLDAALSRVANGEKAAHRALERLDRYRAAVLQAAVTGELTREWREAQMKNTKAKPETGEALLERLLAARRARWEENELRRLSASGKAPKDDKWKSRYAEPVSPIAGHLSEIPKEWALATFDQITTLITKGSSPNWQGFNYCDEGIIFVRSENVRWGSLDLIEVAHLPPAFNEKEKRSILEEGDVLLNLVGASIGRAAIATAEVQGGNVNQAVAVIRLVQKDIMNKFAVLWLISSIAQKRIHSEKVDFARANFSLANTRSLPIPIPSLEEQSLIVHEVERRLSAADRLAASLGQQLARAQTTRQSLLRDAFAGRLVPQDPIDEPASALLKRILTARETEAKKPKGKPMPKSRSKKKVTHRPLLDVLREHRKPMTPEQLFRESGYEAAFNESDAPQDLVDAFYKELRKLTDKPAKVAERKDSGQQAWLRVLP